MSARTWKGLMRDINRRIDTSLTENVYPAVKEKMLEHIISDVHSQGRGISNGIEDGNNIISSKIGKGKIMVMNIARNDDSVYGYTVVADSWTMFSRWINDGEWMDLGEFIRTGNKTKRDARPFIDNTIADLKSNKGIILDALKIGIEGRK